MRDIEGRELARGDLAGCWECGSSRCCAACRRCSFVVTDLRDDWSRHVDYAVTGPASWTFAEPHLSARRRRLGAPTFAAAAWRLLAPGGAGPSCAPPRFLQARPPIADASAHAFLYAAAASAVRVRAMPLDGGRIRRGARPLGRRRGRGGRDACGP